MRTTIRRSLIYAADIGIPLLTAVALGLHRAALLGAIAGLLCSVADEFDASLVVRLRTLVLAIAGVVAGGFLGHELGNYQPVFWVVFALAVFLAGWLNAYGKGPHLGMRFGAIALGVVSGTPQIAADEVAFPLLACGVSVAVRILDHWANGPLPAPDRLRPPSRDWEARHWARFSLAYAAAAAVGLWVGVRYGAVRAVWITVVPLIVMQPRVTAGYRRAIEFVAGTGLGVAAAWAVTSAVQSVAVLCAIILVLACLIPHQFPRRFWLQTAMIALMLLVAYRMALADARAVRLLIFERFEDVVLGTILAAIGIFVALAESSVPEIDHDEPEGPRAARDGEIVPSGARSGSQKIAGAAQTPPTSQRAIGLRR